MIDKIDEEIAFLACLNDNQSLKKLEYVKFFQDATHFHEFFVTMDSNNSDVKRCYSKNVEALIEKTKDIQKKNMTDFYIDVIRDYQKSNINIIPFFTQDYPKSLIDINNPPFIIYQKGDLQSLSKPAIGVVGTRNISQKGIENVKQIVKICVDFGYVIVSGLALGTDTYAHKAAIDYGGETIAVLPGDIDHVVPNENKCLADEITKYGSLISEITYLTKMHKGRYIERNRITSALSEVVIVIETGESGGSIRQAEISLRHGIRVFVIRPVDSDESSVNGYNKLVNMGAISLNSPNDLCQYLCKTHRSRSNITTFSDF